MMTADDEGSVGSTRTYTAARLAPVLLALMGFMTGFSGVANLTADDRPDGGVAAAVGWAQMVSGFLLAVVGLVLVRRARRAGETLLKWPATWQTVVGLLGFLVLLSVMNQFA